MLGFTVINGHRGPRHTEPSHMSLAERLRRAKHNDDLEIVEAHENPSISLDLSESELNALAGRLIGGRIKSRPKPSVVPPTEETKKKKSGGKKMRGKKKKEFLARMQAGKRKAKAKSNPRRRRHAKHNPSHMYAKYNPTRAETAAREDFLTMRMAQGDTRAQADAAWKQALGMAASARRRTGTRTGVRRRFGGLARVSPRRTAVARRRPASRRRRPVARRRPARSAASVARMSKGYKAWMRARLADKIAHVRGRGGKKRWYVNARLSALRARHRSYGPKVSQAARNYLKLHGISKVNAGGIGGQLAEGGKALIGVLPEVLVAVGSAGVHTYLGSMAGKKLVEKYGASYASWSGSVSSLAIGVLGFLGLRMSSATAKYSVPFLTGGVVGAGVLLLADNQTKGDAAKGIPSKSWGRALELPIGSVVLRSEFAGFDPYARHNVQSIGEVLPRGDFAGMGEVISRRDAVAMVGEAEDRALNRLLGEVSQLHADTASGF